MNGCFPKNCKAKTVHEVRKVNPLLQDVSDDHVVELWGEYWTRDTRGFPYGPCYCQLVCDHHRHHKSPELAARGTIEDFVKWATVSPLQLLLGN